MSSVSGNTGAIGRLGDALRRRLRLARAMRMGIKSLLLHPMRAALTALSVFCGVGAVIVMLAIGEGASHKAQEQFRTLGADTIIIHSIQPPKQDDSSNNRSFAVSYGLTYGDLERIRSTVPDVNLTVPVRDLRKDVWHGSRRYSDGRVVGTVSWYAAAQHFRLADETRGRWISDMDNAAGRVNLVAVLGANAARELFPLEDPIGQTVQIDQRYFRVVGVMADQGDKTARSQLKLGDLSKNVYIPLQTLMTYYGPLDISARSGNRTAEEVALREIIVKVSDMSIVEARARALDNVLSRYHPTGDYELIVPLKAIRQAEESARNFTILLAAIGGISLIVGGIGIMNVMLATVTERTREVGIRRALGARKSHIVTQFLIEALVLTLLGGLFGVLAGLTSPYWVPKVPLFKDQEAIVRVSQVLLAFPIAAGVGIIFGLYPAWRAANMDPIEALRHE
ncbi:MAG: Macrolide export ATP-binding/permease protein MacB [Phycisphaerae bacterium]|nr:Macrolide export ATP-binding/permease protein MacB [Phycisphaerae bacterium]